MLFEPLASRMGPKVEIQIITYLQAFFVFKVALNAKAQTLSYDPDGIERILLGSPAGILWPILSLADLTQFQTSLFRELST